MSDRAERLLEQEMHDIYRRAARELDYRPTYLLRMLNELGGLRTAKKLLQDEQVSEGFATLLMHRRLDLTMEALVIRPEFNSLFTDAELTRAHTRLTDAGYVPPRGGVADSGEDVTAKPIPPGITREHVLAAIADIQDGVENDFGEPKRYYLVYEGMRYAPKAVIGLAAKHAFGQPLHWRELYGGNARGQANYVLRQLGFTVIESVDRDHGEPGTGVRFGDLLVGEAYGRKYLAKLWGYKSWNAIGRGIVTPAGDNKIILFITRHKQQSLHQYEDHFEGDVLHMEGETNRVADQRIIGAAAEGDEIHLFYRDQHHMDFTYYGQVTLREHTPVPGRPTLFVFDTGRAKAAAESGMRTEEAANAEWATEHAGEKEGRKRIIHTAAYERSAKNRAAAIMIHGTKCMVCGFDFNAVYGAELARDYVQVHHKRSITDIGDSAVDPKEDLVPLCANCHCMAHRTPGRIVPIEELQSIVRRFRK